MIPATRATAFRRIGANLIIHITYVRYGTLCYIMLHYVTLCYIIVIIITIIHYDYNIYIYIYV